MLCVLKGTFSDTVDVCNCIIKMKNPIGYFLSRNANMQHSIRMEPVTLFSSLTLIISLGDYNLLLDLVTDLEGNLPLTI